MLIAYSEASSGLGPRMPIFTARLACACTFVATAPSALNAKNRRREIIRLPQQGSMRGGDPRGAGNAGAAEAAVAAGVLRQVLGLSRPGEPDDEHRQAEHQDDFEIDDPHA